MTIKWSDSVVEAVARRRAVVVLGAGSSFHSTPMTGYTYPPDWSTFLTNASLHLTSNPKKEAKRLIKSGEFLSACEVIKSHLGVEWANVVQNAFGDQRLTPGVLHEHIYSLDLPIVMTTNFDKVYQSAATALSASTVKVKTYRDVDLALIARGDAKSRVLLKVHGTIDDIGTMVFTRSDYIRLRTGYPLFQRVISSISITNTLIFIGCGLRDPDFILLLEDLAAISSGFGGHICIIDSGQSKELEKVYLDCFGLRCERYKKDATHSELPVAIADLSSRVTRRRAELAATTQW